jgi:archaellum component FlaC
MDKDHLEILLEDIQGKFDLVLEGHDGLRKEIRDTREELCEKINSVDFKVETLNHKIDGVRDSLNHKIDGVQSSLNQKIDGVRDELGRKIDAVASDLTAHRRDTEAHTSVYKVKEGK